METRGKPITTDNAEAIAGAVAAFVDSRLANTATKEDICQRMDVGLYSIYSTLQELENDAPADWMYENPQQCLAFVEETSVIYYPDEQSKTWKLYEPLNKGGQGSYVTPYLIINYGGNIVYFGDDGSFCLLSDEIAAEVESVLSNKNFASVNDLKYSKSGIVWCVIESGPGDDMTAQELFEAAVTEDLHSDYSQFLTDLKTWTLADRVAYSLNHIVFREFGSCFYWLNPESYAVERFPGWSLGTNDDSGAARIWYVQNRLFLDGAALQPTMESVEAYCVMNMYNTANPKLAKVFRGDKEIATKEDVEAITPTEWRLTVTDSFVTAFSPAVKDDADFVARVKAGDTFRINSQPAFLFEKAMRGTSMDSYLISANGANLSIYRIQSQTSGIKCTRFIFTGTEMSF